MVKVLFFGATSVITGKRQMEIGLPDESKAVEIFDQLMTEYPALTTHRLLFSINQHYATGEESIRDGDELAIFTAVSGG